MNENEKNPMEYGYMGDETVTLKMTGAEFMKVKQVIDFYLSEETKPMYPEKYKYIHKETGAPIAKLTDKNRDVAMKVVDINSTLASNPVIYRTAAGLNLIDLQMLWGKLHMQNVENGSAIHMKKD